VCNNYYPLTHPQKGIWYIEKLYPNTSIGNIAGTFKIRGDIDYFHLEKAINMVLEQNDSLRFRIIEIDGEPKQYISEYSYAKLDFFDFSMKSDKEHAKWVEEQTRHAFKLVESDLYYFAIEKMNDQDCEVYIKTHHLISDAWTMTLIVNQIIENYYGIINNIETSIDKKPSYTEFIVKEENYKNSSKFMKDKEFWNLKFEIIPEISSIKVKKTGYKNTNADRRTFICTSDFASQIRQFCVESKTSVFAFFLSVFVVYMSKITFKDDITIGTPVLNRSNVKEKNMLGMFISTVPLKITINEDKDFVAFMQSVTKEWINILRHHEYPYDVLLKDIRQGGKPVENLYDIVLSYQNAKLDKSIYKRHYASNWHFNGQQLDSLCIHIDEREGDGNLVLNYDYLVNLFTNEEIEYSNKCMMTIIQDVLKNPGKKISQIDIMDEEEKQRILYDFNNTAIDYPREKTIHQLFEEQVERTPDYVAVVFENKQFTYKELNEKANQLARLLREKGVKPNNIVGIMVCRSLELMVGIIAILKAGGAFLPIDPDYPSDRIRFMLDDSNANILLIQFKLRSSLNTGAECIDIDDEQLYLNDSSNLYHINRTDDLCYVIYTSGSSGAPKGVLIEHKSCNNFVKGIKDVMEFSPRNTVLSVGTISFDIFVFETIPSLLSGSTVVIANQNEQKIPVLMGMLIRKYQIDKIMLTPSRMLAFLDDSNNYDSLKDIKEIMLGGEALSMSLLESLRKITNARIFNAYGPTEITVAATIKDVTESDEVNIGKPIANTKVYILDNNLNPVPIGVQGELYIGGAGLARGYLDRDGLTSEKFVSNPFVPGERMYKSGDLVCWSQSGEIEYLGRIDNQIKIRGLRIELGEIEKQIAKFAGVRAVVVVGKENEHGTNYLCAYVVADSNISLSDLRAFLSDQLPRYMIPTYFVIVDEIPLSPSGKISLQELPDPELYAENNMEYVTPANETEYKLAEMWINVLQRDKVGVTDNFFELGGDSLSIVSIISKIHKEFNVEIPFADIYKLETIKELSSYIFAAEKDVYKPILPVKERNYYPMSSAQKRMFVLMQLENDSIAYNAPAALLLHGEVNMSQLENAFKQLIKRHEILRTTFHILNGEPVQRVLNYIDLEIVYMEALEEEIDHTIDDFLKPFDLSEGPLFRVSLVKLPESRYLLLLDMHHIISDGASVEILLRELNKLYLGETLTANTIQYRDYSVWQKELSQTDMLKKQEEYWSSLFSGEIPVLDLPLDYPRPTKQSFDGNVVTFKIDRQIVKKLKKLASKTSSTLYMVLLAAYNILLYKYTAQEDIIVGSPVANRRHADLENVLGMFVNTLAMRNYPSPNKSFTGFLKEVKENSSKAFENQDYQFEELVGKLKLKRDLSRNPLFDTMFVLQSFDAASIKIGDLKTITYKIGNRKAKFDILLEVVDRGEEIAFNLEYCSKLFKAATIERLAGQFNKILREISNHPEIILEDIDVMSKKEKYQLLFEFNKNKEVSPIKKTMNSLFEDQVERTPETAAVICEGEKLSYYELNKKSNQLARTLRDKGIQSDSIVGIMMYRSLEMVIGIMAILKAGGAFLPIDPDYPEERISYMLENSNMSLLLTSNSFVGKIQFAGAVLDISNKGVYDEDSSNLISINKPTDLIYLIYTSGSTGKPKGVMLEHKNIVNLMRYQFERTNLEFNCRVLQFTTNSFDVCYQEIFSTLLSGGELYIVSNLVKRNVLELIRFIEYNEIKTIFLPPSYLKIIINEEGLLKKLATSVKHIIVAGEQFVVTVQFEKYLRENGIFLHNHYGPSETHVVTTYTANPEEPIPAIPPIGKPISNTGIYIVNKNGALQPMGTSGELCISGDNVGRGYINRPDLTSEKFVSNPFTPGERMYKTGDLARWRSDGNIEFLGRIDHQVKVRGFRIELDEIESQLLNHELVKEVVVIAKEDSLKNKYLCAYLILSEKLVISELKNYLSKKLPDYMIPSYFIQIKELPLTPNGKIDRKALPEPSVDFNESLVYEAPSNMIEEELARIWSEILQVESIGINDNFFELGGDSLSVIRAQIKAFNYDWNLSTQDFYQYQTIKELAGKVLGELKSDKESLLENISDVFLERLDQVAATHHENETDRNYFANILITGATGFLGIHILSEILESTKANVYCLLRDQSDEQGQSRLLSLLDFYFPCRFADLMGNRIFIVNGDITLPHLGMSEDLYSTMGNKIDVIIHSAALVKHYGNYHEYEKINVQGTKELINFSLSNDIVLAHISTIGVSGTNIIHNVKKENIGIFTENDFYVGQNFYDNVYIKSKFEAERLIFEAVKSGLHAVVLRVGNLTGRYSDGQFQINIEGNAFYNRIRSIIKLQVAPENMADLEIDLTPVDYCSKAIIQLLVKGSPSCGVFHLYNCHKIKGKELLDIFNDFGLSIRTLDNHEFKLYVKDVAKDEGKKDILQGIIQDFNNEMDLSSRSAVIVDSQITQDYLQKLNFKWPEIGSKYIEKIIRYLQKVGFIKEQNM